MKAKLIIVAMMVMTGLMVFGKNHRVEKSGIYSPMNYYSQEKFNSKEKSANELPQYFERTGKKCEKCRGRGYYESGKSKYKCAACRGTGKVLKYNNVNVVQTVKR